MMDKGFRFRWSTWAFVLLVVVLFFEILVGFPVHLESEPVENKIAQQNLVGATGAEQKMEGVHLVESRSGTRDWELFAEAAEGYQGTGTWELKNVKVLFYNLENVEFTVTGARGSIDTKSKDMNISGNVQTLSSNGYRFQTPKVNYQASVRILKSPEKIKMTGPPDSAGKVISLQGDSMETQVDQSRMTIKDNVSAQKALPNGREFLIKSKGAEFSGQSNQARFFDQVSIEVDTMRMEGPEANFQYDKGTDFLSSILVKGGVKVSDMDKYATSESVKFDPLKNQFVLNGRPRVVQNNDEITGDQIVFIDGGKRVKVENIRARMEKE
jgi:LPS export ABC transporter protein LptC